MANIVQQTRIDLAAAHGARRNLSLIYCLSGGVQSRDVPDNIRTFAGDYAARHFDALKQVLEREDPRFHD